MGVARLRAFLLKYRRVALDTSIFIYHLEENPAYAELASDVFNWIERPNHSAMTSTITMTELLVHPYRTGDEDLVNRYFGLLSTFPHLAWIAPDLAIADLAAQLRARHNLRTPDALQVATAIRGGAEAVLTNDEGWMRIEEIEVGVLERLR